MVSPRQRYARHVVHRSTTGVPRTLEGAAIGHCFDPWRKMGARGDQGAASGPRTEFWPELERGKLVCFPYKNVGCCRNHVPP